MVIMIILCAGVSPVPAGATRATVNHGKSLCADAPVYSVSFTICTLLAFNQATQANSAWPSLPGYFGWLWLGLRIFSF